MLIFARKSISDEYIKVSYHLFQRANLKTKQNKWRLGKPASKYCTKTRRAFFRLPFLCFIVPAATPSIFCFVFLFMGSTSDARLGPRPWQALQKKAKTSWGIRYSLLHPVLSLIGYSVPAPGICDSTRLVRMPDCFFDRRIN